MTQADRPPSPKLPQLFWGLDRALKQLQWPLGGLRGDVARLGDGTRLQTPCAVCCPNPWSLDVHFPDENTEEACGHRQVHVDVGQGKDRDSVQPGASGSFRAKFTQRVKGKAEPLCWPSVLRGLRPAQPCGLRQLCPR